MPRPAKSHFYCSACGNEAARWFGRCPACVGPVPERLLILTETDLEVVLEASAQVRPDLMVVDSIQTLARADLEGGPGTVTQVRECGLALMHYAKGSRTAVFLVGHVTK